MNRTEELKEEIKSIKPYSPNLLMGCVDINFGLLTKQCLTQARLDERQRALREELEFLEYQIKDKNKVLESSMDLIERVSEIKAELGEKE